MERDSRVDSAQVIQVIEVCSLIGRGVNADPVRILREYYTLDGKRLAREDTWITGADTTEQS